MVTVTLVHAPACHFCDDARTALAAFEREQDLTIELVEADSADGRDLVARHRPAMFPLVLVDGEYLSAGRLPRRKLQALLAARASTGARS